MFRIVTMPDGVNIERELDAAEGYEQALDRMHELYEEDDKITSFDEMYLLAPSGRVMTTLFDQARLPYVKQALSQF